MFTRSQCVSDCQTVRVLLKDQSLRTPSEVAPWDVVPLTVWRCPETLFVFQTLMVDWHEHGDSLEEFVFSCMYMDICHDTHVYTRR